MSCNDPLKHLQAELKVCLADPAITPGQIVEIVRETLLTEANTARQVQKKATDALELLKTPSLYATSDAFVKFTAETPDYLQYPQAAQFVNDGLFGAAGQDTICLG